MIKAILFDLGEVLIHVDEEKAAKKFADFSTTSWEEIHAFLFNSELDIELQRGSISLGEYFVRAREKLALSISFPEFKAVYVDIFTPFPEMEALLQSLKASRQFKLVLVSNTDETHVNFIGEHYSVLQQFEEKVYSFAVKSVKPEKKIFEIALQKAGFKPVECVFIDNKKENFGGAIELGMKVIHFQSPEQLKKELAELGVEVKK